MTETTNPTKTSDAIIYIDKAGKEYRLQDLKDTIPLMQSLSPTDQLVAELVQTIIRYTVFRVYDCDLNLEEIQNSADLHSIEKCKIRIDLSKYCRWYIDALLKEIALESTIQVYLKGKYLKLSQYNWLYPTEESNYD